MSPYLRRRINQDHSRISITQRLWNSTPAMVVLAVTGIGVFSKMLDISQAWNSLTLGFLTLGISMICLGLYRLYVLRHQPR